MRRKYELMLILNPNKQSDEIDALIEKITGWITELEGSISKDDRWGKRKLAYPINKESEGFYNLVYFELDSLNVKEFNRKLNLDEDVMKYLQIIDTSKKMGGKNGN